jgi:O-antigen/teichoic acid export membrane protein
MKITIIQKLLMVTLSILLYYLLGSDGIIIGISLSFVPFIALYYKEFKNTKIDFKVLKFKKEFMINNYLLSFTRMFASSIDKIIIMPIFGFAVLGNYALGMQFYMVLLIIPNIIYQYVLPQDATGNPSTVLKKLTILVSVGLTILGIIFSPIIIGLMFPKFLDAIIIVQIISLGVIPGTINFMYISKFLGDLQNKIVLISSGIFLVTIILGMIVLGKLYDVHGIAASFVLAGTTESVFLIICNKYYKIQKKSNDIV